MKILLLFLLTITVSAQSLSSGVEKQKAVDWMKKRAIPFDSVTAGSGFADLRQFGKIVGNKRIVALGEATHGTREMFQMKHRLVEYLVEQKGFNVFLLEAPFPTCLALNDYILNGKGTAEEALNKQGFWNWDTAEILEMVKWMRRHNEKPTTKNKIQLYGIDAKYEWIAIAEAFKFLEKNAPEKAAELKKEVSLLFNFREFYPSYISFNEDRRIEFEGKIEKILRFFDDSKLDLIKKSNQTEWQIARQNAVITLQSLRFNREIFGDKAEQMNPESVVLSYRVWHSAETTAEFLAKNDREFFGQTQSFFNFFKGNFRDVKANYKNNLSETERAKLTESANLLKARLERNKTVLIANTSENDWKNIVQKSEDLTKWLKFLADGVKFGEKQKIVRDRSMAENAAWAIEQSGKNSKAIVWMHNFHASRRPLSIFEDDTTAAALDRKFGKEFITFGFSFYQGSFRSEFYALPSADAPQNRRQPELRVFQVTPSTAPIDQALNAVGQPRFFLDLRGDKKAQPKWLWQRQYMRHFGSGFNEIWESQSHEPIVLPESFDAVIFIRDTTASEVNPLAAKQFLIK